MVLLSWFVAHQRTATHPMLPLALFSIRNFWAGDLATVLVHGALSINGIVVAVYLQQGAGLSAALGIRNAPAAPRPRA